MIRFAKRTIFYHTLILSIVFYAIYFFFIGPIINHYLTNFTQVVLVYILAGIVIWLGNFIYALISWFNIKYEVNDIAVILYRGIIYRNKVYLTYEKINSIDITQNLLQQFFGISKLSLDSGATTTTMVNEINISTLKPMIYEIHNKILEKKGLEISKDPKYKLKIINKILYILFSWYFEIILFTSLQFLICNIINLFVDINGIVIMSTSLVVLAFTYFFIKIGRYLVSNHKFIIRKNEKSLYMSYGLLTKVKNTVPLDKIKAVVIEEGLIKRLFKLCTIKIEVIGIAEADNSNINVLVPLCRRRNVNKYITELLDESLCKEDAIYKSSKCFKFYFCNIFYLTILANIFISLNVFGLSYIFSYSAITSLLCFGILLIISIISVSFYSIIKQSNQGLYFDKDKIVTYNSSFNKTTTIIKYNNVIGLETKSTKRRNNENVISYIIHYYNHNLINKITVDLLPIGLDEQIKKNIKY